MQNDLPAIEVDRERVAEVLANLLTNALRHTPPGGTVKVSVASRGDRIQIDVTDNGEGIASEHLDRVFERFYRVDPPAREPAEGRVSASRSSARSSRRTAATLQLAARAPAAARHSRLSSRRLHGGRDHRRSNSHHYPSETKEASRGDAAIPPA